ncbi:TonB-dependent receptor [Tenacibaculum sp. AHE15PA]|uniref:TonB-dependent receptor n=1 Tax=unclassified Tenacibaculum TaxID=2635139 RepID=UPI001C4E8BB0|nr:MULTISPECIES: TonB-dependent receptor [unclassified Tenacibaculum]QXP72401.1 TonB-dependent receptor [Tenacibaculum sp. AHE14PA]QXP76316.1 TonB-dependent receptor [Tenacibaculum sp. AHE15PA]
MKQLLFILCLLIQGYVVAQTIISGNVTDNKGNPIEGANVYLDGTYDGTSTDNNGIFSFSTSEVGTRTLIVSFISFETFSKLADVKEFNKLKIKLREDVNTLDAVTINAGTFEAGDNAKVTALKPLDIVTTASALGDFVGALQTLPGTSTVDEDGRLFVRGGDAEETQIFVDGIRVFKPYSPSANNIPSRGRFSPFLFKGITFSTGGYSAEYGQALSSVLLLNTTDEVVEEKTDLSFMTVGLGVGNTQVFGKNSLSVNASYINLAPYQSAFQDRNTWHKPVQSFSGEAVYRFKFKNESLLKVYGAFSYTDFDLTQEDINYEEDVRFGLTNRNLYFNSSYKNSFGDGWKIATGVSFTNDQAIIKVVDDEITDEENSAHFKVAMKKRFSNRFKLNFGAEYFVTDFKENYKNVTNEAYKYGFDNNILGTYAEADIFFSKKLASKIGIRGDYSELLNEFTFSPRASIAYKSGKNAQFSFAYGRFFQNPKNDYLKFNTDFKAENTSHFIANYQYVKNKQIFRVEGYYKKYQDLVKYDTGSFLPTTNYSNLGNGYAKGIDVFWRDNKSVKNTDYWVSYSFLDTERNYKNYPTTATPNFASAHNLSVVGKHFIKDLKSQVGFSYNFASGRNYTNPNKTGFLNNKTKNYNSVSVNWAYLISQQKILYFSVNNVLGHQNVFGYNYKNTPNMNGVFDRQAIVPNADRFFFVGFFWTISDNKKDNQLDNL